MAQRPGHAVIRQRLQKPAKQDRAMLLDALHRPVNLGLTGPAVDHPKGLQHLGFKHRNGVIGGIEHRLNPRM